MGKRIARELKEHIPFTAVGALAGILLMVIVILTQVPHDVSHTVFHTMHPVHVFLSALVTTAMYARYRKGKLWAAILIGWTGAISIGTVSDALIPYLGGKLLHAQMELHIPFVEHWWINLVVLAGVGIGYWRQTTRIPHFGHVLVSTWASLFYITAFGTADWIPLLPFIFLILFIAVWIPCCLSDIAYPLLFIRKEPELPLAERQQMGN